MNHLKEFRAQILLTPFPIYGRCIQSEHNLKELGGSFITVHDLHLHILKRI